MRLTLSATAFLFLAAATAQAAPKACPIEKTVYRLNGFEQSVTLRFVDNPELARQTPMSAVIHSSVTGKTYRYTVAVSNGYSNQYLVDVNSPVAEGDDNAPDKETRDQTPTFSFFSFDNRLRKIDLPDRHKQGPAWVFIPDLGTSLWYAEMAHGQKAREAIETEMWRRAECVK